ncbi:MAG: adenylate kinase family protein [Candidatus Odinarchaeota archaeon]|nr:adenylate kinase family protein [Candidatus Odinarchaeota archaeon]
MSLVIVITGTPGTGKTTVAKLLAEHMNSTYLSLNEIARKYNCFTSFDAERKSWIIDEKRLSKHIVRIINGKKYDTLIIDTHFGEIIPDVYVSFVFILRTHPEELQKRLKKRNWPKNKIRENIQAEILGTVTYNALQTFSHKKIFEIDTTKITPEETMNIISKIISNPSDKFCEKYKVGVVDWLKESSISSFF